MASLFDLAAGLSQFDGQQDGSNEPRPDPSVADDDGPESALSILDGALQSIYGVTQPVCAPSKAASTIANDLGNQSVIARAPRGMAADPDMEARRALQDVTEELEQLRAAPVADAAALVRSLADKFLSGRLDSLPATPFVLLARRKTRLKLEHFQQQHEQQQQAIEQPAAPTDALCERLRALTPTQRAAIDRLRQLPTDVQRRLPPAQRELAQFAQRFDTLVHLPETQLRQLPERHQQLVRRLRTPSL